jgi:Right handed beta helix region
VKPTIFLLCLAAALLCVVALACAPVGATAPAFGPRQPVGPDVPLSDTEKGALARRVTVEGRTASAIQSACDQAVRDGIPVVFLPAGQYQLETSVRVPATLTLLGEGAGTVCRTDDRSTQLFVAAGDRIRFTRMKLQGPDTTWNDTNGSIGISVPGKQNIHIDHCELLGFMRATDFSQEATAQVDHCSIHHNLRNGYGYGVDILEGAYVLVTDNEFSENRLSLTSNGALDWDSGPREGIYRHIPGVRKTHWEFRYNRIGGNSLAQVHLPQVETHPGMDGTFVAENNLFENINAALGLRDGSGLIRVNTFRDLTGPQAAAIWIITDTHNGIPVENAIPHDVQVLENTFQNVGEEYRIGSVVNIWIDGQVVLSTRKEDAPPPPAIPWLQEMGDDGILRWKPARP